MRKKRTPAASSADLLWDNLPEIIELNLVGFRPDEEAVDRLVRVLDKTVAPRVATGEIDSVAVVAATVYHKAVGLGLVPELCGRRPF